MAFMKKQVADKIRILRLERNLSQENMADELGISVGAYSNIETGKTDSTVTRLMQIVKLLDADVMEIISGRKNEPKTVEEAIKNYGFATKEDLESVQKIVDTMHREIIKLSTELRDLKKKRGKA